MKEFITHSDFETQSLGEEFGKKINSAVTFAFFGGMGMGKTAFIRGVVKGLDSDDRVSSPTFALVHEYAGRLPVYHFDMYRVESWDDLYSTGFFDYLGEPCVLLIEWSENIENALPDDCIRIHIEHISENEREIIIEGAENI